MQPIPKRLLIHTVTLHKVVKKDAWGAAVLDDGMKLTHVRLESSSKIVRDKNNAEIQLAATLFYDCKNSRPPGLVLKVDDILSFNDEKYRVQMVEPLYDDKHLHHYEIGLVKYA